MKFRLSLFILFTFLLLPLANKAQVNFYVGPRVGLGFSTFTGKDASNVNYPLGTIIGVYTQTQLSDRISIDAELNYISVGSTISPSGQIADTIDYKISLGYLTLPLNFDYRVYKGLNIQAGVQFGYLFTALTEQKYQNIVNKDYSRAPYNRFDAGPTFGAFYQFEQGLQCGIRYYIGLQSIYKQQYDIHNTGLQFLLTYRFPTKKVSAD